MDNRKKLGEILVDLGVLQPGDVERILTALNRRLDRQKFGEVARNIGLVKEEHILAALAVQMDLFQGIDGLSVEEILSRLLITESPLE